VGGGQDARRTAANNGGGAISITHRLGVNTVKRVLLAVAILLATPLSAQESIPPGTILPLQLNSTIDSRKMHAGHKISARLMQAVPLPDGSRLRAGAKVLGNVVAVNSRDQGEEVAFRFDTLVTGKRRIPITTHLRALATMMDVHAAQLPLSGPDRGTSEFYWTTVQIGGEAVYHGGGPVTHGSDVVGKSVSDGVLVRPAAHAPCRGDLEGNDRPQALWVFASNACGLYDLPELTLVHAGRSNPRGQITIASTRGRVKIRAGSGLLLRVTRQG
jgi:hypothetical protein